MTPTKEKYIATIKSRRFYLSGEEFRTTDIASNLDVSYSTAGDTLRDMHKRGLLSRRLERHGMRTIAHWKKCETNWLRASWRPHTNTEMRIPAVTGPAEWT